MKNIKFIALIALALTLGMTGCKKGEADNSSDLFGTVWKGEVEYDIDEVYYGKNEFKFTFSEGKKVLSEGIAYKITKAWSAETSEEIKATGSFSLKNDKIKITLEKPIAGYESSDVFPVIFEGTISGDKMTLSLNGATCVMTKVTLPEV